MDKKELIFRRDKDGQFWADLELRDRPRTAEDYVADPDHAFVTKINREPGDRGNYGGYDGMWVERHAFNYCKPLDPLFSLDEIHKAEDLIKEIQ